MIASITVDLLASLSARGVPLIASIKVQKVSLISIRCGNRAGYFLLQESYPGFILVGNEIALLSYRRQAAKKQPQQRLRKAAASIRLIITHQSELLASVILAGMEEFMGGSRYLARCSWESAAFN